MEKLSFSENYTVLLRSIVGKNADITHAQYCAGVALGAIYDLLRSGCASVNAGGAVSITGALPEEYSYLEPLYNNIHQDSKNTEFWLEYYCCGPTSKPIRPIIDAVYSSLAKKGYITTELKKGIFKTKTCIHLCAGKTNQIVEAFQRKIMDKDKENCMVFSAQMLMLADVLKKFFTMGEQAKLAQTIASYKQCAVWSNTEPYVNRIKNFVYQNSVYSGAVYNE